MAVRSATGNEYQSVIMDDNGDGSYDSHTDGFLARDAHLGITATTTAVFPEIYRTQGDVSPNSGDSTSLFAKVDLPHSLIERTWAVIVPPDSPVLGDVPITSLDEVELIYNANTNQYEGTLSNLNTNGRHILSYFTQGTDGLISSPLVTFANVTAGGSNCNMETAYISLKDWIIHIGAVDYQALLGSAQTYYDVGLKYQQGSNPMRFNIAYVEKSNGYSNCSNCRADLSARDGQLSLPSIRITDTSSGDMI